MLPKGMTSTSYFWPVFLLSLADASKGHDFIFVLLASVFIKMCACVKPPRKRVYTPRHVPRDKVWTGGVFRKMGCFSRIKTTDSEVEIDEENWTWISNQTPRTLLLRDKYRQEFGMVRHLVKPYSDKLVAVDTLATDTYYRMGVLTRGQEDSTEANTDICVDSEDLLVYSKIIVSREGGKFNVKKVRRPRSTTAV